MFKILLSISLFTTLSFSQPLQVTISLEKDIYIEGEPVIAMISIFNSSNKEYIFTYTFSKQQNFIIEDDEGVKLRYHYEGYPELKNDRDIKLKSGEEIIHFSNITSGYGNLGKDIPYFDSFRHGKYKIKLIFEDFLIENGRDTLRSNSIFSNELNISVVEPDEAFSSQLNELESFLKTRPQMSSESFLNEFKNLISTKKISKNSDYLFLLSYIKFSNMTPDRDSIILNNANAYWAVQYSYSLDRDKIQDFNKLENTLLLRALNSNMIWNREMQKYNHRLVKDPVFRNLNDSTAETTTQSKRKFLIGAHTGYRFNLDSYPILNSNLFFGFSLQIPLSDFVSIQPELNIWTSNFSDSLVIKEYSVIDIPLLLVFNILDGSSGVDFSIGPGIGILNTQSEKLISLNIGVAYWVDIVENICWTAISRLQIGGTINPGGGNSKIISVFLGTGFRYAIKLL